MSAHRETEIKLRVPDPGALLDRLLRLRARCSGRVLERNTLFDTPNSDLRRRKCLLRLRVETPARSAASPAGRNRAWLTFKSPTPAEAPKGYKHNMESEARIERARNWPAALGALGFRPGFRYEKFRTSFCLGAAHLGLDETPVGIFLEIEGAPREIDRVARALGFSPRDYIRATYGDLYAAQCRRRGQLRRHMLFRA